MKNYKTNSDIVHAFAYAQKKDSGTTYGGSIFFRNDIIYSYGYHFPMAIKVRNENNNIDFVYINSRSYSNTTSKHQSDVRAALSHYQQIYIPLNDESVDFAGNFSKSSIKNIINSLEAEIIETANLLGRARSDYKKESYTSDIISGVEKMRFLVDRYKIKSKLPARIKELINSKNNDDILSAAGLSAEKKERAKKIDAAKARKRRDEAEKIRLQKESENVEKWKNNEFDRLYSTTSDYLRISKDGLNVETSQGVKVDKTQAVKLLKLIDQKKIVGEKINDTFLVTGFNGFLKVGCHNISIEEINYIKENLN